MAQQRNVMSKLSYEDESGKTHVINTTEGLFANIFDQDYLNYLNSGFIDRLREFYNDADGLIKTLRFSYEKVLSYHLNNWQLFWPLLEEARDIPSTLVNASKEVNDDVYKNHLFDDIGLPPKEGDKFWKHGKNSIYSKEFLDFWRRPILDNDGELITAYKNEKKKTDSEARTGYPYFKKWAIRNSKGDQLFFLEYVATKMRRFIEENNPIAFLKTIPEIYKNAVKVGSKYETNIASNHRKAFKKHAEEIERQLTNNDNTEEGNNAIQPPAFGKGPQMALKSVQRRRRSDSNNYYTSSTTAIEDIADSLHNNIDELVGYIRDQDDLIADQEEQIANYERQIRRRRFIGRSSGGSNPYRRYSRNYYS